MYVHLPLVFALLLFRVIALVTKPIYGFLSLRDGVAVMLAIPFAACRLGEPFTMAARERDVEDEAHYVCGQR